MMKTIGSFVIEVYRPYPVSCVIQTDKGKIRFNHKDIADLKHAVNQIEKEAKLILGEDSNEV